MKRGLFVGVLLGLLAATSVGIARQTMYGIGALSCGKWLEVRREDSTLNIQNVSWLMGWMSSAGYYAGPLKKSDSAAMSAWIDQYCRTNPLDDTQEAAIALVEVLRVR